MHLSILSYFCYLAEVQQTLKKVEEGCEIFDDILAKVKIDFDAFVA